jgi:hypothetical protein
MQRNYIGESRRNTPKQKAKAACGNSKGKRQVEQGKSGIRKAAPFLNFLNQVPTFCPLPFAFCLLISAPQIAF